MTDKYNEARLITIAGFPAWQLTDGSIRPYVSGGSEGTGGDGGGAGAGGGDGGAGGGEGKGGTATFTQADIDRAVSDRLARERAKYTDYEELKTKAARLAEIEAANASDLEKAVKAAHDEGRTEVLTAANARLVAAEARAAAAELRFKNPAIAIKAVDLSEVTVGDDGEVDAKAVRGLLEELAKAEPYLVGDGRPKGDADQGARSTSKPESTPGVGRLRAAYASTSSTQ